MTLIGIGIGLALLISLLAWKLAFAQTGEARCFKWDAGELETVIDAFTTLSEPGDDSFLRVTLSPNDYIQCRRARALLARKCLKYIDESASFTLGMEVTADGGEEIRLAMKQLTRAAIRVRFVVPPAKLCLFLIWLFPKSMFFVHLRLARYRELVGKAGPLLEEAQQPV